MGTTVRFSPENLITIPIMAGVGYLAIVLFYQLFMYGWGKTGGLSGPAQTGPKAQPTLVVSNS